MKKISLSNSTFYALIDDEDYAIISRYNWTLWIRKNRVYAQTHTIFGGVNKVFAMHQMIMPTDDPKIQIDHRDGNGLNNQKFNLRYATNAQNQMNRSKGENTSSQYKGVYWNKERKLWVAGIKFNGKRKYLGASSSELEAAKIYNKYAKKLFGDFAYLNEITEERVQ